MKTIISRQNPEIKNIAKLKLQKEIKLQQKFVAEGIRTCKTLIQAGFKPEMVYVTEKNVNQGEKIVSSDKITIVADAVMEKISASKTPSGILAIFPIPKQPDKSKLGNGIVLYKVANPGNMGTLIRSCAAMGFKSVVLIEGAYPWASKVVQSSVGTIGNVDIFVWSWDMLLKNKGTVKLIAMVVAGGKKPNEMYFDNFLLVIGSEAHGISEKQIKDCDEKLTIAMPGKAESLNAAVAGSIAMYLAKQ